MRHSFRLDRRGNVAIIFALALVPVVAMSGAAIDISRLYGMRNHIQAELDSVALNTVRLGPYGDPTSLIANARASIEAKWGAQGALSGVAFEPEWLGPETFQLTLSGTASMAIIDAVPGMRDRMSLTVRSGAELLEPRLIYKPPTVSQLDPEAGDYNRIYVYCYNAERGADSPAEGRSEMIPIADNGGTVYDFTMPQCDTGEVMSYRLMNVRNSRTKPRNWDNPSVERYDYYTDTTLDVGTEHYDLDGWDILETVMCPSLEACKPQNQGGVIPTGRNRNPQRTTEPCGEDKFIYYGWEDRPPGNGWTDRDYDDIRVIIECPVMEEVGERATRLIF